MDKRMADKRACQLYYDSEDDHEEKKETVQQTIQGPTVLGSPEILKQDDDWEDWRLFLIKQDEVCDVVDLFSSDEET